MSQKLFPAFILLLFLSLSLRAQIPGIPSGGRGPGGMNREQMNVGRFYGKIVDEATGKPIEFATVQLNGSRWDSVTKTMKQVLMGGMFTSANGDFSIDKLPPFGDFTLRASAIGYDAREITVKFDLKFEAGKPMDMQKAMSAVDKDLGNIALKSNTNLKEVVVEASDPSFRMEIDKKVFNVDKNSIVTGGTAEDVLKTVPSVNVDMDGNVTLRNNSPQIFVDGRPSTLTMEQIPADAIQSVELITNPSAKYDASGGMGGIINIVLKKNRKLGYNGGVRLGVDMRGRLSGGGDINVRDGKFNMFAVAHGGQRKSISTGYTDRINYTDPMTTIHQDSRQVSQGLFGFTRFGVDYFMDNRNTITVSQSFSGGEFSPVDELTQFTDTVYFESLRSSRSFRSSNSTRTFRNAGSALSFKHLFPREGKELTADVNYNYSKSNFGGNFLTRYFDGSGSPLSYLTQQRQAGDGKNNFLTIQTDYINPIGEDKKIEGGARAAFRNYTSVNQNYITFNGEEVLIPALTNDYEFEDYVVAAYSTFSQKISSFSYQVGLRAESSEYTGILHLPDSSNTFTNKYPVSLFPSAFLTYNVGSEDDIQFSYTRKINRPNFFQIIPYTDFTDSLNLSRGNPDLRPEFTNSFELSYLNTLNRKNNILFSVYYKTTQGIVTRYQVNEFSEVLGRSAVISTFRNASASYSYGMEVTSKNNVASWLDMTANINVFKAIINGQNIEKNLRTEQLAWFGKLNANFKMPKNFSLQVTADYQSKTALPASGGSRGGGMGGMGGGFNFGGGGASSAQGYILPSYSVDLALRKEFLKNKMASVTVAFNDIFRTRVNHSYAESMFFVQETFRRRDPQFVRINFNYRFGKFDVSLFKRKNMKNMMDGMQDIPVQ